MRTLFGSFELPPLGPFPDVGTAPNFSKFFLRQWSLMHISIDTDVHNHPVYIAWCTRQTTASQEHYYKYSAAAAAAATSWDLPRNSVQWKAMQS